MDFNAVTPGIVIGVYVIVELIKYFWLKTDEQRALLPVICIMVGIAVALALYIYYPEGINVSNGVDAVASGGLSGIAATGCNQLWKQFQKYNGNMREDE